MRGWDRVARGSTEAQVARAGLEVGLRALWAAGSWWQVRGTCTGLAGLSTACCSPAALPLGGESRAHREEAPSGPPHPYPPSLQAALGFLDPVACACGPSVTKVGRVGPGASSP